MSRTRAEAFDEITKASVAEILYEMARTLERFSGCAYLTPTQDEHVSAAQLHIDEAVAEWIDDVMDGETQSSQRPRVDAASPPEHPLRGLDCVLNMLAIYRDDINERDFTPMQFQNLMIAAHNFAVVARELMKNVH